MKREDSRTYMTDRLLRLADMASGHYRVSVDDITHYQGIKFDQCAVIEHDDGKFKVIDWSDRDHPEKMECEEIIRHHKCQYVLKCQYNPKWRMSKLRPFFYFEKTKPREFSLSLDALRLLPKTSDRIYWRGNNHLGRQSILNTISDLVTSDSQRVPLEQYYKEIATHRLALSLPGLGKSCHREYECFGIGTVVISPRLQNINHIPLIPNRHYICVESLADIREATKLPVEKLDVIRQNAMTYYDEYIRFESSVKWMWHLLELQTSTDSEKFFTNLALPQ